ncbi:MAG: hypothetical protein NWQ23_16310 [Yoonia sp.]|uniref:hypothetical protein n=1 Tax=Yoonia sp. TaxID=2212373 RepID=UPI00273ECFF5|nr:hypothetical protein [Yoonia sp.]MDP5086984.1 hypothetical protein [Yoonia sp.]
MQNKTLRSFVPPVVFTVYDRFRKKADNPNSLFDGDDSLYKEVVSGVDVYGEYGCGKSTKWMLNNTSAKVIAVDTSEQWIEEVKQDNIANNGRLNINFVNLGRLGGWGRPIDYSMRESFSDYTDYLWRQTDKPNVVLVDGRFRVCCFLTSLKFADEGTQILFDDYTNRPHYHFVEKYCSRIRECGRQCLFIVPSKDDIDFDELEKDIGAFRHVMD